MAAPQNRVPVRVARGTKGNLDAALALASLQEGELVYAKDENTLYVVENNVLIPASTNLSISSINTFIDVDTASSAPTNGQVLTWNNSSSNWVPSAVPNDLPTGGTTGQVLTKTSGTNYAVGWSTPSSGGGTLGPYFHVTRAGTQSFSGQTSTLMTFTTTVYNYGSCFSSNKFTPNVAGIYFFSGYSEWGVTSAHMRLFVRINGTTDVLFGNLATPSSYNSSIVSGFYYLNGTTDYAELWTYHNVSVTPSATYFQGALIQPAS